MQADRDRLARIVDIPERPLAVLDKASRRDDAGQVGAADPQAVPDLMRFVRAHLDRRDVLERDLELSLESKELIGAADVNDEARWV